MIITLIHISECDKKNPFFVERFIIIFWVVVFRRSSFILNAELWHLLLIVLLLNIVFCFSTDPSLYYPREGGTLYSDRAGTFSGGNVLSGIAASPVAYTIMVKDLLDAKQLSGIDSGLQSMQIDPILGATLSGKNSCNYWWLEGGGGQFW